MLILPIKKKWFDMILSGEKKEEYREIKPYYESRLPKNFGYFFTNGKLLIFHCAVGDTVHVVLPTDSHITKAQINKIEIKPTLFGKICYFIEPVGNRGRLYRYFGSDFGKSVFLTEEQAKEALNGMNEMESD